MYHFLTGAARKCAQKNSKLLSSSNPEPVEYEKTRYEYDIVRSKTTIREVVERREVSLLGLKRTTPKCL